MTACKTIEYREVPVAITLPEAPAELKKPIPETQTIENRNNP